MTPFWVDFIQDITIHSIAVAYSLLLCQTCMIVHLSNLNSSATGLSTWLMGSDLTTRNLLLFYLQDALRNFEIAHAPFANSWPKSDRNPKPDPNPNLNPNQIAQLANIVLHKIRATLLRSTAWHGMQSRALLYRYQFYMRYQSIISQLICLETQCLSQYSCVSLKYSMLTIPFHFIHSITQPSKTKQTMGVFKPKLGEKV